MMASIRPVAAAPMEGPPAIGIMPDAAHSCSASGPARPSLAGRSRRCEGPLDLRSPLTPCSNQLSYRPKRMMASIRPVAAAPIEDPATIGIMPDAAHSCSAYPLL